MLKLRNEKALNLCQVFRQNELVEHYETKNESRPYKYKPTNIKFGQ